MNERSLAPNRKEPQVPFRLVHLLLPVALVSVVFLAAAARALSQAPAPKPAIVMNTPNLGKVIATHAKLGIYYWNVEKRAGGKIRCTGSCAVAWPPVYVRGTVAKHVAGVTATFGTVKRGSRRQLTVNGLPAYTYYHDKAGIVLCDNVDGWFAVRAR
jgi:predicted lipoprotein with Yx(FWY)xxD motif